MKEWGTHVTEDIWEVQKDECKRAKRLLKRALSDIDEVQKMTTDEILQAYEIMQDIQNRMQTFFALSSIAQWAAYGNCTD